MFETLKNAFKSKEIRVKIWITLALILVYRIGCYIPIPTFNVAAMQQAEAFSSDFLSILNVITGMDRMQKRHLVCTRRVAVYQLVDYHAASRAGYSCAGEDVQRG